MNKHHDGLYSKVHQLDIKKLKQSCIEINEMTKDHLKSDPKFDFDVTCAPYAKVFEQYNFLMYPLPEIHNLYDCIQSFFYECQTAEFSRPLKKKYFIQSWVNIYEYGEFIDWHGHGKTAAYAWHGFYCVNVEPSKTTYRFMSDNSIVDVESKNGLLVLGKSNTDNHRTWPWTEKDNPRITIAFDIVPDSSLLRMYGNKKLTDIVKEYPYFKNHWIPI